MSQTKNKWPACLPALLISAAPLGAQADWQQRDLPFAHGRAGLSEAGRLVLDELAPQLEGAQRVVVIGRPDSGASLLVARRRAEVLRASLQARHPSLKLIDVEVDQRLMQGAQTDSWLSGIRWLPGDPAAAVSAPTGQPIRPMAAPLPASEARNAANASAASIMSSTATAQPPVPAIPPARTIAPEATEGRPAPAATLPSPGAEAALPASTCPWTASEHDGSLYTVLERWASKADYRVAWSLRYDYPVHVDITLCAMPVEKAIEKVLLAYRGSDKPLKAIYHLGNRVIEFVSGAQ